MRVNPNLSDMTEEQRKLWEKEWKKIEGDNTRKDLVNKLKGGRGWIF